MGKKRNLCELLGKPFCLPMTQKPKELLQRNTCTGLKNGNMYKGAHYSITCIRCRKQHRFHYGTNEYKNVGYRLWNILQNKKYSTLFWWVKIKNIVVLGEKKEWKIYAIIKLKILKCYVSSMTNYLKTCMLE